MLAKLVSNPVFLDSARAILFGICLAVAGLFASFFISDITSATGQAQSWMNPVITKEEAQAMTWVRANTAERELFVTDIFGGEFLMGSTLREGTEGGDWAIVPNVVQRMGDVNDFYKADSPQKAHDLAAKYGAKYVISPNRQVFAGFEWVYPERAKFADKRLFELVFQNSSADGSRPFEIYKVK